jgi:hypothetical protein
MDRTNNAAAAVVVIPHQTTNEPTNKENRFAHRKHFCICRKEQAAPRLPACLHGLREYRDRNEHKKQNTAVSRPGAIGPLHRVRVCVLNGTNNLCRVSLEQEYHYLGRSIVIIAVLPFPSDAAAAAAVRGKMIEEEDETTTKNAMPARRDENEQKKQKRKERKTACIALHAGMMPRPPVSFFWVSLRGSSSIRT